MRNTLLGGLLTVAILVAGVAWLLAPGTATANAEAGREFAGVLLEGGLVTQFAQCANDEVIVAIERIEDGKGVDRPEKVRVQFLTGKELNVDADLLCILEKLNKRRDSAVGIKVKVPKKVEGQFVVRVKMD